MTSLRTAQAIAALGGSGGGIGYALSVSCTIGSPADSTSYYFGAIYGQFINGTAGRNKAYVPKSGTITAAQIFINGTACSAEDVSVYVRVNNTTDYLIQTQAVGAQTVFANVALSGAVSAGDYIEIKIVCPAWATNPTAWYIGGYVYIE